MADRPTTLASSENPIMVLRDMFSKFSLASWGFSSAMFAVLNTSSMYHSKSRILKYHARMRQLQEMISSGGNKILGCSFNSCSASRGAAKMLISTAPYAVVDSLNVCSRLSWVAPVPDLAASE